MAEIEDIEGLDLEISDGWGDYPLDAVFVRTEPRTVGEVVKRIENKRYILDPDFQRDFVWSVPKQSKLIESCVMRIPLPVFYVAEATDGRIIVVDGLQRLTTFSRFINNQFRLSGLATSGSTSGSHALEGKLFKELPIGLQERIQDTPLTMYILDSKAPERAKLDIFERVNSGEVLTRQQMRNALFSGAATEWLKIAAASDHFRAATDSSLNTKTMRDREAINRFCAFKLLGWEKYTSGDMDDFLARGLRKLEQLSDEERYELMLGFDKVMILNQSLFGRHAFRKSLSFGDQYADRSVINISLFEISTVCLFNVTSNDLGILTHVRQSIIELFSNPDFIRSITYSTNSSGPVQNRFKFMNEAIGWAELL